MSEPDKKKDEEREKKGGFIVPPPAAGGAPGVAPLGGASVQPVSVSSIAQSFRQVLSFLGLGGGTAIGPLTPGARLLQNSLRGLLIGLGLAGSVYGVIRLTDAALRGGHEKSGSPFARARMPKRASASSEEAASGMAVIPLDTGSVMPGAAPGGNPLDPNHKTDAKQDALSNLEKLKAQAENAAKPKLGDPKDLSKNLAQQMAGTAGGGKTGGAVLSAQAAADAGKGFARPFEGGAGGRLGAYRTVTPRAGMARRGVGTQGRSSSALNQLKLTERYSKTGANTTGEPSATYASDPFDKGIQGEGASDPTLKLDGMSSGIKGGDGGGDGMQPAVTGEDVTPYAEEMVEAEALDSEAQELKQKAAEKRGEARSHEQMATYMYIAAVICFAIAASYFATWIGGVAAIIWLILGCCFLGMGIMETNKANKCKDEAKKYEQQADKDCNDSMEKEKTVCGDYNQKDQCEIMKQRREEACKDVG
ncbi:MAG TPA: hypothetical protein DCM05_07590 [Elusimicrobia bacterium]|nr:hypothetical protein [Elusimicrobiota bacterium]